MSESSVGLNVIKVGYSHSYSHINWVVKSRNSNLENKKRRKMGSCCCKTKKPKQPPFPAKRIQKSASQTPKSVRTKSTKIQEQSMVQRSDSSSSSSSEDQSSINREKVFRSSMHVNVLNNTRTEYHVQQKSMKKANESLNTTMSGSYKIDA